MSDLAQDLKKASEVLSLATVLVPQVAGIAVAIGGLIDLFRRGEATPDQQRQLAEALDNLMVAREVLEANYQTYKSLPAASQAGGF